MRHRTALTESPKNLVLLLDGRRIGTIYRDSRAHYRLVYEPEWRFADDSYPISLSMPLTAGEHGHREVEAFLWGLLPDNQRTLDHYGRRFGVSPRNPLAILAHIGADCAGAIQLLTPDKLAEFEGAPAQTEVDWVDDAEIAKELRSVKATGLPGRDRKTTGRFSLAGAQPKIALYKGDEAWGRPHGRTPTTHILKPPSGEYAGFAENEHLCLGLAAELGLAAAKSEVRTFEGEVAIVVERFDRRRTGSHYRRVHQEDMCQALSVLPWNKYENEGGPDVGAIVGLLQESSLNSETDVSRFIDIIAVNWVLAATDAHAKNYALLHARGGGVRLAPFYDMASFLPYTDERLYDVKLAMRIGREYHVRKVARSDWVNLSSAAKLSPQYIFERLEALLPRIPMAARMVAEQASADGLGLDLVDELMGRISERSIECMEQLARGK